MTKFICRFFISFLLIGVVRAEVTLNSQKISYDPNTSVITASGNVVVIQTFENGDIRELHAEKIEYNKKSREIKLIGSPMIKETTGEIIYAQSAKLDPEFQNAIAKILTIILKDSSKVRAQKANKKNEVFTFENATYSPCKESDCSVPLWDLTAEKVIYDREKQQFIYKNAKLRMKGIPVFFTPYFSHPSPEVKRKTGFLTPIFRNLTDIGFFTGFPFYATLGNDKDLTITPFLHSKRRRLASMDYRQKFYHGDLDISASGLSKLKHDKAQIQDKRTRWHVDSVLKSQNFDNKRLMIRLNRASDTTYKNVYPVDLMHRTDMFLRERCNDSKVVCEFYDMNYFLTAESHVYQTADRNTAPKVCPQMTLNCKKDDFLKGELFFDSDTVYLTRKKEKSTMFAEDFFRTTNKVSWQKATDLSPVVLDVKSGVRADIYNVSETEAATRSKNKIFPVFENQISAFVPFISEIKTFNQTSIWGPKVALSSVETSKKRRDFEQNEDSLFDTFSDLNLHSLNRVGYDSVENGERVSAGFENSIYNSKRRWFNTFFGQSRNIGKRQKTKFAGRNSTVGRLALKPMDTLSFRIRFVGMPFMEKTQLFESGVNASYKNVTGGVGYLYDKKISHVQENGVSQLGFTAGINLTNFWSISGAKILNMKKKNGKRALAHGATLTYRDECLEFSAGVCNTKFRVGDIKPRTTIIVSLILKNIGNIITPTSGYGYSASVGQIE